MSVLEVQQVICCHCDESFWETSQEGIQECPWCLKDVAGSVLTDKTLIYPVLIDPLTGIASLGFPTKEERHA